MSKTMVFSHDVTAAILVSQNNETGATLVFRINPVGVELLFMQTLSYCSKFALDADHVSKNAP